MLSVLDNNVPINVSKRNICVVMVTCFDKYQMAVGQAFVNPLARCTMARLFFKFKVNHGAQEFKKTTFRVVFRVDDSRAVHDTEVISASCSDTACHWSECRVFPVDDARFS